MVGKISSQLDLVYFVIIKNITRFKRWRRGVSSGVNAPKYKT